jgi:hypothetical protein
LIRHHCSSRPKTLPLAVTVLVEIDRRVAVPTLGVVIPTSLVTAAAFTPSCVVVYVTYIVETLAVVLRTLVTVVGRMLNDVAVRC